MCPTRFSGSRRATVAPADPAAVTAAESMQPTLAYTLSRKKEALGILRKETKNASPARVRHAMKKNKAKKQTTIL